MRSHKLSANDVNVFKANVLNFYVTLSQQILKRFDFNDEVLKNLSIIDPSNIVQRKNPSIVPLLMSFPNIISSELISQAYNEFREIRNIDFSSFSKDVLNDIVAFWQNILNIKRTDGTFAFIQLRKFIPCMLILPHSSASVERLFSDYNLNKNKLRNRLNATTMRGILAAKSYVKVNKKENVPLEFSKNINSRYNYTMYKQMLEES